MDRLKDRCCADTEFTVQKNCKGGKKLDGWESGQGLKGFSEAGNSVLILYLLLLQEAMG